jgi:hypothetical protein
MRRRILILTYTQHIFDLFLSGLKMALLAEGHTVINVFHCGEPRHDTEFKNEWCFFDMHTIESFKPDRIIIFNGFAQESFGATSYLKDKYKCLFVERGWLPQAGSIYMDPRGLGGRSSLAHMNLSDAKTLPRRVEQTINDLRDNFYNTEGHPELGEYILVPLQLEKDTSIILDSPYFKTMASLLFFVKKSFPGHKVIVTPHPLNRDIEVPDGFILEHEKKTKDLAKTAKAIIGINSTSMIEALIHYKPVGFLGRSVITASNAAYSPELTLNFPRNLLDRHKPNINVINGTLFNLLSTQFDCKNPPLNVIKQFEL